MYRVAVVLACCCGGPFGPLAAQDSSHRLRQTGQSATDSESYWPFVLSTSQRPSLHSSEQPVLRFAHSSNDYQLDDGSAEDAVGTETVGTIVSTYVQYTVIPGLETVTTVNVEAGFVPGACNGVTVNVAVLDDPNGDGDPDDGLIMAMGSGVLTQTGDGITDKIALDAQVDLNNLLNMAGSFFVAFDLTQTEDCGFPAALDQTAPVDDRTYLGIGSIGTVDCAAEDCCPACAGNGLVRANSTPPQCGDGECVINLEGCSCPADCGAVPDNEIAGETCVDGLDNDCDGTLDCADSDCVEDLKCNPVDSVCDPSVEGQGAAACQAPNQNPNGPEGILALNATAPGRVADTFTVQVQGDIDHVCWWGTYADSVEPLQPCAEADFPADDFTITFYDMDPALVPAVEPLAQFASVPVSRALTSVAIGGTLPEVQYAADLPEELPLVAGECYWVEIQNALPPDACTWLWSSSDEGEGLSARDESGTGYDVEDQQLLDLAWCLGDLTGAQSLQVGAGACPLFGACCDEGFGVCQEGISFADCAGNGRRFGSNDTCGTLDPPCCPGPVACGATACMWCACSVDGCTCLDKLTQADLGGQNGACPIDGTCDGNDRFHALNCFSDRTTMNKGGYPCESNAPQANNVDAGSSGISCERDGVCDGNDAFHALNCFSNINSMGEFPYPCGCEPSPEVPEVPTLQTTPPSASLELRAPSRARAGDLVEVAVYLTDNAQPLRGYQLHIGQTAGARGLDWELIDIFIDPDRKDAAFGDVSTWFAFNLSIAQMVVGMDDELGSNTPLEAYLATYTYRIPDDASGTQIIDVLYEDPATTAAGRTFLFGEYARPIRIKQTVPAVIDISARWRTR